jgi:hypothetical protein
MPTLSEYWFQQQLLSGPFDVYNQPFPDGGYAWIANGGQSAATLSWVRPDGETVVDLASQLNSQDILSQIDKLLGSKANRTSGMKAQALFWWQVPYYSQNPGRHGAWDQLIRIYFDFHIGTPWYCSDANGDIDYYIVVYLDSAGHLGAYVDGWSYNYGGGGPFCTGSINDALNAAVPSGVGALQTTLDSKLALLSGITFWAVYVLPGTGTKVPGEHAENADVDAAIAVLS